MTARSFPATVVSIVDGDTAHLSVRLLKVSKRLKDRDLGFSVYLEQGWLVLHYTFRFLGCNAAEHGTPGGDAATAHLKTTLTPGLEVTIGSVSNDKYSRYDATITLPDGTDLISALIAQQWAAPYTGEGPKNTPPWPRTVTP